MAGETILHVGYDSMLIDIREGVLRRAGYQVLSVQGNQEAQRVAPVVKSDLVIVGNGGPKEDRLEIVRWLSKNLRGVPILVMRISKEERYPKAVIEFLGNTPQEWLQSIEQVLRRKNR